GGGGGPGGGGRGPGGGGGGNPEMGWSFLVRTTGSDGDTVDLSKIPQQMRDGLKARAERDGSIPLPDSGTMTHEQYLEHYAKSEAAKAAVRAVSGGPMGGNAMMLSIGPDGSLSLGGPGGRGRGGMGDGGNWGDPRRGDQEEEKLVALRYGKIPKEVYE